MNVKKLIVLLLGAGLMVESVTSHGQDPVTIIAVGMTGKMLLDRADEIVAANIDRAKNTGDALISRMATEANALTRVINANMANQLNTAIEAMEDQSRQVFYRLNEVLAQMEAAQNRAYMLRDASVVDLATRLGDLPLVRSPTFIQSIYGLAHIDGDNDVDLTVFATGLGPGEADVDAQLELTIAGKPIKPIRIDRSRSSRAVLTIARSELRPFYKPSQIAIIDAELKLKVQRKPWWRVVGWFGSKEEVTTPIYLSLFPEKIGTVTVTSTVPIEGWVLTGSRSSEPVISDDCGRSRCNKNPPRYRSIVNAVNGNTPVLGNERLSNLRHTCTPLWGPNSCTHPGGWFAIEVLETNAEQSQATLVIRHWTERNRYTLLADVEEYRQTGITSHVQQVDVYYDQPFRFVIPKTATTFQITGTSLTRQPITVVRDQPSPFFVNKVENDLPPDQKEIIYQVVLPQG